MATDPTNARVVALAGRTDNPDFGCDLHMSGDGGRGWTPARPVPRLPAGADKCYSPDVAFSADGTLYYMFVGLQGLGNAPMGVFVTASTDRGKTFSAPRRAVGPRAYMVRMAIDVNAGRRGRIHLVWVQAGAEPAGGGFPPVDNPVVASRSDDGGRTWSKPVRVSERGRERVVAPAVAVGKGGDVHVLYYDLRDDARDYQGLEGPPWDGNWSLVTATSTDNGRRFGRGVVVDGDIVPPERIMVIFTTPAPAIAADGRGRLYAAWGDARHGDWDVFLRRSADGGRTWRRAIRLNDDPQGNGRNQYLPRLTVAPGGRLDAVFYDRRRDPANVRNGVSYTFSESGGRRFSPNVPLATEMSDSRIGPTFPVLASSRGLFELGSRLGLLARPTGALVAWADTRNAQPGFIQQDIVAVEVVLPDTPAPQAPPAIGILAAVVVAVGSLVLARRRTVGRRSTRQA